MTIADLDNLPDEPATPMVMTALSEAGLPTRDEKDVEWGSPDSVLSDLVTQSLHDIDVEWESPDDVSPDLVTLHDIDIEWGSPDDDAASWPATDSTQTPSSSSEASSVQLYYDNLRNQSGMRSSDSLATQDSTSSRKTSGSSSWMFHIAGRVRGAGRGDMQDKSLPNMANFVVRKFAFTTQGRNREVTVAHHQATWHVKLDGQLVASKAHSSVKLWKHWSTSLAIDIPAVDLEGAVGLIGTLRMEWVPLDVRWKYALSVGSQHVGPSWTKTKGALEGYAPPEVALH